MRTIVGFFGFGVGITIGVVIGYFLFIYFQPTDVKVSALFLLSLVSFVFILSNCTYLIFHILGSPSVYEF